MKKLLILLFTKRTIVEDVPDNTFYKERYERRRSFWHCSPYEY